MEPIGNRRIRVRDSKITLLPISGPCFAASKFVSKVSSLARLLRRTRLKRITDGRDNSKTANNCPKPISVDTTTRFSSSAVVSTSTSSALCRAKSRRCTASCPVAVGKGQSALADLHPWPSASPHEYLGLRDSDMPRGFPRASCLAKTISTTAATGVPNARQAAHLEFTVMLGKVLTLSSLGVLCSAQV